MLLVPRPQLSIDISYPQLGRCRSIANSPAAVAVGGRWERRTDGWTPDRYTHTQYAASANNKELKVVLQKPEVTRGAYNHIPNFVLDAYVGYRASEIRIPFCSLAL